MVTGELKATMTVEEVSKMLGISLRLAYEEFCTGHLPARKIGRKWIISRQQITEWLNSGPALPITQREKRGNN